MHQKIGTTDPMQQGHHGAESPPFRLYGPRYISNLEGLVIEMDTDKSGAISAKRFHGKNNQQWLLQPHPREEDKFALASLHDGRYLSVRRSGVLIFAGKVPFYWKLTEKNRIYGIAAPGAPGEDTVQQKLTLPTAPGSCTLSSPGTEDPTVNLVILDKNDPAVEPALRTTSIGRFAHPDSLVYYTIGTPAKVTVFNELNFPIYAAVAGSDYTNSSWEIGAGKSSVWSRSASGTARLDVHISLAGCAQAQTTKVYPCPIGKSLHIQSLTFEEEWKGLKSVLPGDVTYTANPPKYENYIGLKNNLSFTIHAIVFSTTTTPFQYSIEPNTIKWWAKTKAETELVIISVGSQSATPRAYMGRVGYTLQVYRSDH